MTGASGTLSVQTSGFSTQCHSQAGGVALKLALSMRLSFWNKDCVVGVQKAVQLVS
jgi:hypothetical protein